MTTATLDQDKSQKFAEKMVAANDGAMLALMASIGHQTGLFDTLATLPPATSAAIAQAAGLNERYVREWLAAMVLGRVIDFDPAAHTYALPPEHARWLTRAAKQDNIASLMQLVAQMGGVEAGLVACFKTGGGVPYAAYPRLQSIFGEVSGPKTNPWLMDTTLPMVPGLIERLQAGIDVADMGCGQGGAINLMAEAFPLSRFVGFEFDPAAVAAARAEAARRGLTNARFEVQDVARLDQTARFDLITAFDSIHDQAQPAKVLSLIEAALRPAGTFLMIDVAAASQLADNLNHPQGLWLYTVSCMHCMTVSLAQDGAGLGAMWGEQVALQMLAEAGFAPIELKRAEGDTFNAFYVAGKRAPAAKSSPASSACM